MNARDSECKNKWGKEYGYLDCMKENVRKMWEIGGKDGRNCGCMKWKGVGMVAWSIMKGRSKMVRSAQYGRKGCCWMEGWECATLRGMVYWITALVFALPLAENFDKEDIWTVWIFCWC